MDDTSSDTEAPASAEDRSSGSDDVPASTTDRSSGPDEAPATRRRRRRWPWWMLGTLVVLIAGVVAVVLLAPGFIAERVKERLQERWGASAEVDHVEIVWSQLAIDIYGVRFDDGVRLSVEIDCVEIDLSWDDLMGTPRPNVVVHDPVIRFEAKPAPPTDHTPPETPRFNHIELIGGSFELSLPTSRGPAVVHLTDISAKVDSRQDVNTSTRLDLAIHAAATVGGSGTLHVDGRASSANLAESWSVRFDLSAFELATLNDLWLDIVEMDVDRGFLSLDGELTRTPARMRGRIRPRFEDVALLGADEHALHPMAEALFGHMLMGARSTITVDRPMTSSGSSLPELLETDWQVIIQRAIKQGYARRLSTLKGFTASIGDVKVDFSQGLLQLYEVVIDAEQPVIEIPLVSIGRVDVVFDPTVTQIDARAYKHITLWKPTFTFATGVDEANNQLQFDESWLDTISAIPFATRDLEVHEGRIDVWDLREEEPVNVSVSGIELRGDEMARDLHRPGVRGAELSATATILDEAHASIHMVYEPGAAIPNFDVDMRLDPLALTTLAPTLQTFAGVDAVAGHVGFSAHLSARNSEVEASVVPDVYRPKLKALGRGRMLRKIIIGRALRRMRSHVLEFRYSVEPGDGLLQEFFPQLIQAVFLGR